MTLLDPSARRLTIISTYAVEPERADELVAFLVASARSTLSRQPGYVSANFHVSLDRTQVVNYSEWESPEALAAIRTNAEVVALMQEQMRIAKSFTPVQYELRVCVPPTR